jgi:hypothetical protein
MIGLLLAAPLATGAIADDPAVPVCRPALARKAGGEIATLDVTAARTTRSGRVIEGQLTAFQGMAAAKPGSASTHHLIRVDFTFRCRVAGGRVREARLKTLDR